MIKYDVWGGYSKKGGKGIDQKKIENLIKIKLRKTNIASE